MASLEMEGPYKLDHKEVRNEVEEQRIGNYALGHINKNNKFVVEYVGRSDTDLPQRICDHIGEKYKYFKYSYASSPKNAFEKECQNYHDFGGSRGLDNDIHPRRPDNTTWKCPEPECDALSS